jgi:hypothetical protein
MMARPLLLLYGFLVTACILGTCKADLGKTMEYPLTRIPELESDPAQLEAYGISV